MVGINSVTCKCTPVSILGTKKTFCKILSYYSHVTATDYLGQIWSWVSGLSGQIGNYDPSTPIRICNF